MKFVMYSKDACPWCDRAKELIAAKGDEFEEFKIGRELTRDEFVEQFPNVRTVPYIMLGDKIIGGYESLVSHYNSLA